MNEHTAGNGLTAEEAHAILALRLLIARAANRDSLGWWEDESLAPHARYVLERLFPNAPPQAARSLALVAASTRHEAACPKHSLHLYRLDVDGKDRLALRFALLLPIPVPEEPITTVEALREHLTRLTGGPVPYKVVRRTSTHALQIGVPPCPTDVPPMLHRARSLAWAYLEGAPGQPVFPFCTE